MVGLAVSHPPRPIGKRAHRTLASIGLESAALASIGLIVFQIGPGGDRGASLPAGIASEKTGRVRPALHDREQGEQHAQSGDAQSGNGATEPSSVLAAEPDAELLES